LEEAMKTLTDLRNRIIRRSLLFTALFYFIFSFGYSQTGTITILHLNDTHNAMGTIGNRTNSLIGTLGGAARAATVIGLIKKINPNTMFLHAGDSFMGDFFFNSYYGAAEFSFLNALGLDAMVLGNHEFDLTPQALLGALSYAFQQGKSPVISSNLILGDPAVQPLADYVKPYVIKQYGKIKVGIFGLTTPEANVTSLPSPAVISDDITGKATEMVTELKEKNCNVIICLSHLGLNLDKLLASGVNGINVIIGGHDHYLLKKPVIVNNPLKNPVYIVQTNGFYQNIGKMTLFVHDKKVSLLCYEMLPVNFLIPEEPQTAQMVKDLKTEIESKYGQVFSKQAVYATDYFEEVSQNLTERGYKDTPIGTIVGDAFKQAGKTDIAIAVNGSTSCPLYKGPITAEDIFRVFGQGFNEVNGLGFRIATFKLTGLQLMTGLEFALSNIEQNDEYFIQAAGMKYTYNPQNSVYSRLVSAEINGNPVDPSQLYTVTANEFVPMFLKQIGIDCSDLSVSSDITEYQVLLEYVSKMSKIEPRTKGRVYCMGSVHHTSDKKAINENKIPAVKNYPNPFNPSTTIEFSLPAKSNVSLKIYDTQGREVKTLISGELNAGAHKTEWNAVNAASGVYFYKLQTDGFSALQKIILMK
jgi:5'-nucleotidase / UDP-sugar diphosphatase